MNLKNTGKQVFEKIASEGTLSGREAEAVSFLLREQYLDADLWRKFVNQFRLRQDGDTVGWRGEYWGKAMRGAVMVYEGCRDEKLYRAITESVKDMLTVADPDGKVTTYVGENEFHYWDIWSRKYVILAMEYYYDVCRDETLKREILSFIKGCADDVLRNVGNGEGKVRITDSHKWKGVNSSSILEPMVRLYKLTGEQRYFDFATYIINEGGAEGIDIFRLALENEKMPYQYGDSKAYEMISCFEGIIEYYLATGDERYRRMAVQFGEAVLKTDVTVIGSCGCTHELFDHSRARQTAHYDGVMQETCVTVTWMKFCARLLLLTGEAKYADEIERSWFNGLLGALNTEKKESGFLYEKIVKTYHCPVLKSSFLPFDSYSPLTAGKRGQKVAGDQLFNDGTYFGCCAAIGGAGVGVYLNQTLLASKDGIVLNFYRDGAFLMVMNGEKIAVQMDTDYPASGKVLLKLQRTGSKPISLRCRIPGWSEKTKIQSDFGESKQENGYAIWENITGSGTVELELDMKIRVQCPEKWDTDTLYVEYERPAYRCIPTEVRQQPEELNYISLQSGPIVFAVDSRLGKSADEPFDLDFGSAVITEGKTDERTKRAGIDAAVICRLKERNGNPVTLVDYASAGKDWETDIAAWIRTTGEGEPS